MRKTPAMLCLSMFMVLFSTDVVFGEELFTFRGNQLAKIDSDSGVVTTIGFSAARPPGIDFSPCDGRLFGATSNAIWEFNTTTGASSFVVALSGGISQATAFAFSPDGRLFMANNSSDALFEVDLNTGVATLIGNGLGINMATSGWDFSRDGTLYLVARLTNNARQLYTVDLVTGLATLVGNIGVNFNATDISITPSGAFVSGSNIPNVGNSVFPINLSTGAVIGTPQTAQSFQPAALTGFTPAKVTCSLAKSLLWPPNHKLIDVGVQAQDGCGQAVTIIDIIVYSDEDDDVAAGAGNHEPDAVVDGASLSLRAERKGNSDGRVYLVVVVAQTIAGTIDFDCCVVVVPHNKSKKSIEAVDADAVSVKEYFLANGVPPEGFSEIGKD